MTTSKPMTRGQINRACEILRAQLESRGSELPSDAVQQAFGDSSLGPAWFDALRDRVEAISASYALEINYDDYDDPAWKTIDRNDYAYVGDVTAADYPVTRTGTRIVRFRELEFDHNPTDAEVLAQMERQNCRQPDRAEAETVIRKRYTPEQLGKNPRVGLIGPAVRRGDGLSLSYVIGDGLGVNLRWRWTEGPWDRSYRFIAVCK